MSALDYKAQEDGRRFVWQAGDAQLSIHARAPLDLDRETNGDVLLVMTLRVDALPAQDAWVAMGCGTGCQGRVPLGKTLSGLTPGQWVRVGVPLKCFRAAGADMHHIGQPFAWGAGKGTDIAMSRIALSSDADQVAECAR
jgi:beta-glucosidase